MSECTCSGSYGLVLIKQWKIRS